MSEQDEYQDVELVHFHTPGGWHPVATLDGTITHEEVQCVTCGAVIGSRRPSSRQDGRPDDGKRNQPSDA